ncbi:MAG: 2-dehydropantoate 2-reductase [Paracoccaceae bacterium]|nr:2-dehydropantoate 2-reductase [Paracoccaceae bacterium]
MKICVFGAGAIGGYMAHGLARAGCDVSVVARGAHLAAIREDGLWVETDGAETRAEVAATDRGSDLGPQDYLVITLKAHAVPGVAPALAPLIGPDTTIVTAMNGVPYWYYHGLPGDPARRIEAVDPGGAVSAALPPAQALGCVVYPAAEVTAPGRISVLAGDRFTLGEPSGDTTERATAFAAALRTAGFKAPLKSNVRDEIWMKLWGNVSFNPLSALTGETLEGLTTRPDLRAIARAMMVEAQAVGEAHGARFAIDIDKRIAGAQSVGAHKTSMLQDLERGRPMEIDALVSAVTELGRAAAVATPTIDTVLALVQARARTLGLYDG